MSEESVTRPSESTESAHRTSHSKDAVSPNFERRRSSTRDLSEKERQVYFFVKNRMMDFYKSGIIDRETFKYAIKRVVSKVLAAHQNSTNADFILEEADQIYLLIQKYLKYLKETK